MKLINIYMKLFVFYVTDIWFCFFSALHIHILVSKVDISRSFATWLFLPSVFVHPSQQTLIISRDFFVRISPKP